MQEAELFSGISKDLEGANDDTESCTAESQHTVMESDCSTDKSGEPDKDVVSKHEEGGQEDAPLEEIDQPNTAQIKSSVQPSANQTVPQRTLDRKVEEMLEEMYQAGKLQSSDLDERAVEALGQLQLEAALKVMKQFAESNLEHVSNKSAFLCGVIKTFRQRARAFVLSEGRIFKGPDEQKIKALLERTGYTLDVTVGQRRYGGPPPNWDAQPPGKGSEVFCGNIPRDMFESDLIPLFERCGTIWDMRLMMDPVTSMNRGYAFVTFTTKEGADKAIRQLNSYQISPDVRLLVSVTNPNTRLFIGNIPRNKSAYIIKNQFDRLTEDLKEVIVYGSPDSGTSNRGFCFLEYGSHKSASWAKRRLENGRVKVWNCDIIVDWADPVEEPDDATMNQVKALYVRNLTSSVSENQLRDIFSSYGQIEHVKKLKHYAFVHFETRAQALQAMAAVNNSLINGKMVEVSLARPPPNKKWKEDVLKQRELRLQKKLATIASMSQPAIPYAGQMYGSPRMPRPVLAMTNNAGSILGGSMRSNQGDGDRRLANSYQWHNMSPMMSSRWPAHHRLNSLTGYALAHDRWLAVQNNTTAISEEINFSGNMSLTSTDLRDASSLEMSSSGTRPKAYR